MARVCVFVNETLLDLGALDPHFEHIFGDASTRPAWFGQFLPLWLAEMVTGEYKNFGTIGGGALEVADEQINTSGSRGCSEQVLSADAVRRLKPAREPYRMAAESLGVEVGQVRLVAAHAWDVVGAMRAGCAAAFVARPRMVLNPLAAPPDVVGTDLREVAAQILEIETTS